MTTPTPTPATEPTSAAAIAEWMDRDAGDAPLAAKLEPVAAAVNRLVRRLHNPDAEGVWHPDHVLGATMLAGRLYRRRNTPDGVATYSNDAAVYVQRNDPDVAMLLELGPWARPVVG